MKSVLICNDEPVVMTGLTNKLKELGYDALFECCDGESALSMACANLPDIAILDTAIAGNEGLSAAREIRQKLKIPVILLMSQCDRDTLNKAKKIGITTVLTKPFRGQDLLPALEMAHAHAEEVELLKEHVSNLKKTIESREIIEKAKNVLLRSEGLSEPGAFRKIQKLAMEKRKSMQEIAEAILLVGSIQ